MSSAWGPIAAPSPALDAVLQGNGLLKSLPEAALTFAVEWHGRPFPAAQGAGSADQVRLYHVGKYLQHFTVQPVQFGGGAAGPGLEGVQGWLESYCWNSRMAWLLHVASYENHLMPPEPSNRRGLSPSPPDQGAIQWPYMQAEDQTPVLPPSLLEIISRDFATVGLTTIYEDGTVIESGWSVP